MLPARGSEYPFMVISQNLCPCVIFISFTEGAKNMIGIADPSSVHDVHV